MRKPVLIATVASVTAVVIATVAVLLWHPWDRSTNLADLVVSAETRGYQVEGDDLVQTGQVDGGSVSAELVGRFTTFETSVSLRGRTGPERFPPEGATLFVQISLDGNIEYEAEVKAGDPPHPVKLTISGGKRITLSNSGDPHLPVDLVWSNPRVT